MSTCNFQLNNGVVIMRQELITKTYLKFNELNKDQQSKVIDKMRDINVDHSWFDYSIEDFTAKLTKLGFYNISVEFSGFSSQGDGARFNASHKYRGDVTVTGRYYHNMSMRCDNPVTLQVARRLAAKLYKDLEIEYNYLTSDECIIETIESNEYEFDQNTLQIV